MKKSALRFALIIVCICACLQGCAGGGKAPSSTPLVSAPPPTAQAAAPVPAPTLSPTPSPTPLPTPTPLSEGDFSLTFPSEDTGIGAYKSYQSDDVRIAIDRVKADGVTYYIADIWIKHIDSIATAFARGKYQGGRQPIKTLMKKNDAILAISGDYYGARKNGIVIRNGELYRDVTHYDVCVLYRNGVMKTYSNKEYDALKHTAKGIYQAWGFGPKLLSANGEPTSFFDGFDSEKHNPRAALGYYEPGHYCFVLVDGRKQGYSKGMLLSELSVLFYELGCADAYNLDGGATAILAFDGEYINQPHNGGRSQYDIIYIGRPSFDY